MKLRLKMRRYFKFIFAVLFVGRLGLYFFSAVSHKNQIDPFRMSAKNWNLFGSNLTNFNIFGTSSSKCHQCTKQSPRKFTSNERNALDVLLDQPAARPKLEMFRLYQDLGKVFLEDYCKTCALVTNSGILTGSKAGKYIDSNQCVFRMNNGPVTGYESDVGSRTTHRLLSHISIKHTEVLEIMQNETRGGKVVKYLGIGPPGTMLPGELFLNWAKSSVMSLGPTAHVYLLKSVGNGTETSASYFGDIWKLETNKTLKESKTWMTMGFFSVVVALNLCDSVSLFGMDTGMSCAPGNYRKFKYHYYQKNLFPTACSLKRSESRSNDFSHDFFKELDIFRRWSNFRNISFQFPAP